MEEVERRKKVIHDIALVMLYESVDRGGECLSREIYSVLVEVGMVVGVFMDEVRKSEDVGKRGGDNMTLESQVMMEVERAMNLVRGFGWEKVREEVRDSEVYITVKKKVVVLAGPETGAGPT